MDDSDAKRVADAFLVIGLAAIFFPLAHLDRHRALAELWQPCRQLHPSLGGIFRVIFGRSSIARSST